MTDSDRPETPRQTRFICTIGPRTLSAEALAGLHQAGMNIARVNGSHGSLDDVRRMVAFLREHLPAGVEILLDLPGNKIRIDNIAEPIVARRRRDLRDPARTGDVARALHAAASGRPDLGRRRRDPARRRRDPGRGHRDPRGRRGHAARPQGAQHPRHPRRRSPSTSSATSRSSTSRSSSAIDYVGLSFVRAPEQVRRIKSQLVETNIKVVAKVETAEAIEQLATILRDADLIMIDRGDLEAEIGRENVPLAQKSVIKKAREAHVPVIVASQFMTSMVDKPVPFMAEVSDIANAVLDRADILMLSEETAIGKSPRRVHRDDEADRADRRARRSTTNTAPSSSPPVRRRVSDRSRRTSTSACSTSAARRSSATSSRTCAPAGSATSAITVVTGHNHAQIEHYLRGEGFGGSFVYNPWFATTNMLVSLWLARPDQNLVILYGDIIFDPGILADVLATPGRRRARRRRRLRDDARGREGHRPRRPDRRGEQGARPARVRRRVHRPRAASAAARPAGSSPRWTTS